MVSPSIGPKRIVFRANAETLGLVAAAVVVTLALSTTIHSHQTPPTTLADNETPQDWAGHLSDVAVTQVQTASTEPMSSASLVVPKSQLALPSPQPRARPRTCEGGPCLAKALANSTQVSRERIETVAQRPNVPHERSLISRLNPLNHLPDASTLGRPFTYAGEAISDWVRRF